MEWYELAVVVVLCGGFVSYMRHLVVGGPLFVEGPRYIFCEGPFYDTMRLEYLALPSLGPQEST